MIVALLEGGADIFDIGDYGRTPCELLPDNEDSEELMNLLCITSLHLAAEYAMSPIVISKLIELGADPNALDQDGVAPIHAAAALNPRSEILQALISAGARVDTRILNPSYNDETPLHLAAAFNSNPAVAKALIDAGAVVNVRAGTLDSTPLHYVVIFNSIPEVIPTLVEYGANLDATDKTGFTPCDYFDQGSLPAESRNLVCR